MSFCGSSFFSYFLYFSAWSSNSFLKILSILFHSDFQLIYVFQMKFFFKYSKVLYYNVTDHIGFQNRFVVGFSTVERCKNSISISYDKLCLLSAKKILILIKSFVIFTSPKVLIKSSKNFELIATRKNNNELIDFF